MKGFGEQNKSKEEINQKSNPLKEKLISQAFSYHSQGNISEAVKYYQYFINEGYKDYRVFSNYGIILKGIGKLKEAEIITRKAIEINPDSAMANYNLGLILKDLNKLQDAESSLNKAIQLNPNYADAHYNLASILNSIGKRQEAELSLRKVINLNPNHAKAHYSLGIILRDIGKFKEAEILTRKAIGIEPNFGNAYTSLGIILRAFRKLEEAEIILKKAIQLEPSYEAYFAYASCLFEKKEFNLSIENLEKAKEIIKDKSLSLITDISIKIIKSDKIKSVSYNENDDQKKLFDKKIDRLIFNREVEDKLISYLFTIKTNQLDKSNDTRYGKGVCSDFFLFNDSSPIISKLAIDIEDICKKELGLKEIFIIDSFFNIFISGSGQPPHRHISFRDINFNLTLKKYSLVYYLDVGDQCGDEPGILKLHKPEEDILPRKGMIVIIGADRYHSVVYKGNKKRVMIGVNFYGL